MEEHLKNTVSMRFLSTQMDYLDSFGYSTDRAASFLKLKSHEIEDATLRIDILTVETLYRDAAKALSDPLVGLKIGHSFRVSNFGQTGSIYTFCRDLKQVIQLNARYQRLTIDAGKISYENMGWENRSGHFLSLLPYDEVRDCHHVLNMIAGAYATTFNWLSWGIGAELKSVSFSQAKPADLAYFEENYDCPLFFEQERIGIEFVEQAITAPLTTCDDEKLSILVSKLDSILKAGNTNESLEVSVRQSIRSALSLGYVSLPIVATRLKMSERQLRQSLKKADLKYRVLLETERQKIFAELHEEGVSFSVISQELCYNDQAAFNRAFKRWYGVTPGKYTSKT